MINFKNRIKSRKAKFLIALILLSISSVAYLLVDEQKTPPSYVPPPAPLQLIYIYPPPGKQESFWTTTAIEFRFNQSVDLNTLRYKVSPQTDVAYSFDNQSHSLYIRPAASWKANTEYKIEITSLTNYSGSPISSPISYEFEIEIPDAIFIEESPNNSGLDPGI